MNEEKKDNLLPSPELLEKYEAIHKGISKDLLKLVIKEQEHRHNLQKKYLNHFRFGQFFGAAFLLFIISTIYCLAKDYQLEMAYLMSAMFGLLIVLILMQYRKDKNIAINNRKTFTNKRNNYNNYKKNNNNRRNIKKDN